MTGQRREFMRAAAALAAAGLLGGRAAAQQPAWNKAAFETRSLADTVRALGGSGVTESRDIVVTGPDIAEDGALVSISVTSRVPGTEAIYILVDRNANWLAAGFDIPPGTAPSVSTRVKMAETANVLGLVRARGQFYVAAREVKVTLGGCGG